MPLLSKLLRGDHRGQKKSNEWRDKEMMKQEASKRVCGSERRRETTKYEQTTTGGRESERGGKNGSRRIVSGA